MSLTEKTVLAFGAGAIAKGFVPEGATEFSRGYVPAFLEAGARVVVVSRGRSADDAVELFQDLGNIVAVHCDATDRIGVESVFYAAVERYGGVDVIINGSGGVQPATVVAANKETGQTASEKFRDITVDDIHKVFDANYTSKVIAAQVFSDYLLNSSRTGSVVNITSMSGLRPLSKVMFYSDAFASVESFTHNAASFFGQNGIGRVNNVAVGFMLGEQNRKLLVDENTGLPTPRGSEILSNIALGRHVTPKEIASMVLYLADDDVSSGITGATYRVDAGFGLIDLALTAAYRPT
ncbi:SDR family oxidoreductase [Candidatus Woesearchaeota archaeon]|nr:MAG: D-mannonate oxidoreductase [archaeon GW2011_AR4]MBS3130695.1 SDR family oxidoreductase [Candidatus Woesearchaeota archaeon]HIH38842.1 SDR family oxidoreductase [Candidatus Woesearchaeota archaeon]HIH48911.1 SDR family oxidoreductase [Candidatus Woesearchaeota archaeon]HIJ04335.1 SDR family oxidoreductase [Candidatus Woesearchaeota archaeon]